MSRRWHTGKLVVVVTPTIQTSGLGPSERLSVVQTIADGGYPVVDGRTFFK
ncbi:MAG: hypothetical protein ACI8S6_003276, partial [Myxococcota bacterium]